MLQVARLAPKLLGESADLVAGFLRSQQNPDGGFQDRGGASDLYYTVFGLEGLIALRADLPIGSALTYLRSFGTGADLDFVHLACLARCWAALPLDLRAEAPADAIAGRVEAYRSSDGGYAAEPGLADGTLYGCFLALGTYQDLGRPLVDPAGMLRCAARLRAEDGGYANQQDVPQGLTPSTAAAVTLLRQLEAPIPSGLDRWLLSRCSPDGGFFATPMAPLPDLLSTATALHALSGIHASIDAIREPCLDFIDTLWTSKGGFHGNWTDDILDSEYTFYGLLALGHLSV
ncbi:prenyltransferase/squalene oxidase repeat-containing protein [Fimbriiglobus ruber]|uniref:Putative beta-subunit of geranylgeranyltransferase or farnesyltransferase n=1 Tax=Fimbriiglobus ruber TaxID=1908690 RepID=A0A225DK49_9BACT|nr:prenyltransferase/squalene oxidase repeat-containing protein [Fimbriiglobus ruber]OWK36765.1 putative beta-subunit of geranylgeranyltransferase or farnesyltransferase [Fimbriiglobus ruber]